jgi:hypothetical protein
MPMRRVQAFIWKESLSMSRFEKGHTGRPKGSKNKLCSAMLDDLMAEWLEGGAAAIKIMRIERPGEYVRVMCSILPRELLFENTATNLDDDQVAELIEHIREQILAARQQEALLELKPVQKVLRDGRH